MIPRTPDWWRAYDGAPYAFPGSSLETGIDCWQLYARAMRDDFGRPIDDFGALYAGDDGKTRARAAIADNLPGWREAEWEEGAGVLFRIGGQPAHVGIALSRPGLLLHAHHSCGVTTLDLEQSPRWKARFVGCYLPR